MPKQAATPATKPQDTTPAAATPAAEQDFDKSWDELSGKSVTPADEGAAATPAAAAAAEDDDAEAGATPAAETPAAAPATPAPAAEELWNGLTDKQKAALAEMTSKLQQTEHAARSDAARVSALQQKLNQMLTAPQAQAQAQARPAAPPAAAQPSQALTAAALAGDPAALKTLEEDYPAIGKVVKELANRTAAELQRIREETRTEMQQLVSPLLQRVQVDDVAREEANIRQQVAALGSAHPDWNEIKTTEEFKGWIAQQSPGIQQMIGSRDARDAIHVLDLYKSSQSGDTGSELTARRAQRRQQAAQVPGVAGRAALTSRQQQIPDDFDAAWEALRGQSAAGRK